VAAVGEKNAVTAAELLLMDRKRGRARACFPIDVMLMILNVVLANHKLHLRRVRKS
jgi:hypothetical protein